MDKERRFWIVHEDVEKYIQNKLKKTVQTHTELETYANKNHIPVMSVETRRIIEVIGQIHKPKRILEIGTAIGYSSILFSSFLIEGGKIETIEIDFEMVKIARENIKKYDLNDTINVIFGDANDVLKHLQKEYDLIFIDAAKGQYQSFYSLCTPLLKNGGVLICDNILYRGMVAGNQKIHRRKKHLVQKLQTFVENLVEDDRFDTSLLSIGDGVSVSYRKEKS